jgi:hypothetical protein
MSDKTNGKAGLSAGEQRLIEQLRMRPLMMERVQSIVELASSVDGPLKTADEVEGLLVEALRRLGNTTMNQWAAGAEERVSDELKRGDATVRSRKKKR